MERMKVRALIRLVSAFSVLLLGLNAGLQAEESPSARPNFILIIVDDVSHDDLGCYGNEQAKTPHLDRLAANGLRFENAYLTCSSCSPSRCSLITGRYPHNTGACELHVPLPPGHFLFPEALKQAGYYTVLSGKHHMGQHANPAFEKISPGRGPGREEDWVEISRFFNFILEAEAQQKALNDKMNVSRKQQNVAAEAIATPPAEAVTLADHIRCRPGAYRIAQKGKTYGPFPETQLAELLDQGNLSASDLILDEAQGRWISVESYFLPEQEP